MDMPELGKGLGTGTLGGLGADIAEGNGLDIASQAVADAVDVLAGLGLDLPLGLVIGVVG